ncbi:murein biosynthesis integral membrane protein MurJ [Microbacterium sp. OR21]|uniref:murein biosynthesis integral membrane protein MurJ n=1 Tax=Microbacterium sp. OR21 TaxID=3095346 RepID=UPI0039B38F45
MTSLGRASALIGAGTMISRVTGLLRTIVLVVVLGAVGSQAADAFDVANKLPNSIFNLISVGLLTAVIVPQIVAAARHDDKGSAFISKLFTLGTVVLIVATGVAAILTPWLISVQLPKGGEQAALAIAFAYWCLPQIVFYGLYAIVGETLNARNIFGPFTWAPVVNNILSIIGFLVIGAVFGTGLVDVDQWDAPMIAALGGTATLGILVQAAVLLLFWRRTGIHIRPDFRWRGVGLGDVGKLASWTLLMALVSLATGFLQTNVANLASGAGAGSTVMSNAWLVFMLPYSIIVLSIGTPYFTRISEHAVAGRDDEVLADISRAVRTLGFFIVGALAAVVAAAVPASRVFTKSAPDAEAAALVLLAYLVSLVPLTVIFMVQRAFYAYSDTRTPLLFTLVQCVVVIATALAARAMVDAGMLEITHLAAAVALGQSIASTVQTLLAVWLLHRRLGPLGARRWMGALGWFSLAAVPAGFAGWGVYLLCGGADGWMAQSQLFGALGAALVGTVVIAVYAGLLAVMRTPELAVAGTLLRRFLPGR